MGEVLEDFRSSYASKRNAIYYDVRAAMFDKEEPK